MSNLLKSKFFFGVMVLAIMLAGFSVADAQTTTVVASGYTYSGVMKSGMSGPGISTLQAALNEVNMGTTVVVDGKFGPATLAAVKKFQASKGLVADGVVGPATGAALTAATVAVITVPTGGLPAGCTSTAGYSSTTGVKCSTTSSLPAGCTSTAGYSSTTGAKCSGGSTSSSNGALGGDEGDINDVNETSSDDSDVEEGSTGEIFSFEAEIEGDVMVDRVDFYMEVVTSTSGSEDADDYFSGAILMVDGEEVAELDVDDFDQEDYDLVSGGTDDDEYRLRFSGLDLVFADGDEPEFTLAMVANNSIDTDDRNEEWRVALKSDSIRFVDGQDFTGTAGAAFDEDFGFDEEGEGETLEFKSASSDAINDDETLLVEDDDESEWYEVLKFRLEAEEGDIDLNELVLLVTTNDVYNQVVDDVFITIDGEDFDDFDVATPAAATSNLTFDIDGDYTVEADETVDVVVSMRFNGSTGNYTPGTATVVVSTVSLEGEGASDVEDDGVVTGGTKTLSLSTATITDYSWTVNSTGTILDFFFTVEADEEDFDVLASTVDETVVDLGDNIQTVNDFDTPEDGFLSRISGDSVVAVGTDGYTVEEGDSVNFRIRYTMAGTNGESTEVTVTSIAGQEVPDNKQVSPTATLAVPQ